MRFDLSRSSFPFLILQRPMSIHNRFQFMKQPSMSSAFARRVFTSLLATACLLASAQAAGPTPPDKMTYQGYLVDANGAALAPSSPANYPVVFRIYDASQGGTLLWSEDQIVTVDKGGFSVVLGEGTQHQSEPRDALSSVFSSTGASDRYIGISVTIGTTTSEIAPRLRLLPAPYAFLAKSANGLVGTDGLPLLTTASGGALNAGGSVFAGGSINAGDSLTASNSVTSGGNITAAGALGSTSLNVTGTATAGTFVGNGTIPVRGIIMWSGSTNEIPVGWALCDGRTVEGLQTPNLRDRFVIGAGQVFSVNATGGATSQTLTIAQMPNHSHTYSDDWFEQWSDYWWGTFSGGAYVGHAKTKTGQPTSAVGGNSPVSIMPPYYALAYIMRVK